MLTIILDIKVFKIEVIISQYITSNVITVVKIKQFGNVKVTKRIKYMKTMIPMK